LQPAQHLSGVGMAARRVSRVDEVERFHPVGNPAPHELTGSRVPEQPCRRVVGRHARADPQCVLSHRLLVLRRQQALRAGRGVEQPLDDRDRRVFGRPWRRAEVEPGGHLPTVGGSKPTDASSCREAGGRNDRHRVASPTTSWTTRCMTCTCAQRVRGSALVSLGSIRGYEETHAHNGISRSLYDDVE
jgi:hypothetical protein